jgi:signal transduction histidine kinase
VFLGTLRKLTALNSLVFLLIFLVFTVVLYGYLAYRLFDRVDDAMRAQAGSFRLAGNRFVVIGRPLYDPRIFLLLRSTDGRIVNPIPFRSGEIGDVADVVAGVASEPSQTVSMVSYEGHVYRAISVPYRFEERLVNRPEGFVVRDIIAVSIVDSEVELLKNLLWIMAGSLIGGLLVIVLAGYFLARRAMVPIEAAWGRQQQFVSDASHELRSPVTGIYSNAELMLRHPRHTVEEESNRIDTIMRESVRMKRLIANLLTLARSDADRADLQLAPVDISELIGQVAESFQSLEEITEIALRVDVAPALEIQGDRERLHQLLVILLDNAFKYNHPGGRVTITGTKTDKHVSVSVADTGIGIAPENLPRIFDRFFRGDKARSRDSGGTGLGLAIAKWIVEKHRGKIVVESDPGRGTKFTVTLPLIKD